MPFNLHIKPIRDAINEDVGSGIAVSNAVPENRKH